MAEVKPISLGISKAQFSRLANGHKITVKHEHIGKGLKVHLPLQHVEQLKKAQKAKKNIKIQLSQIEGKGIKDTLKKAWRTIKPVAAPLIRRGLKTAIMAAPVALGQPQLAPVAAALVGPLVDAVGDKVGFGFEKKRTRRIPKPKPVKMGQEIQAMGLATKKRYVENTNQGILVPVGSVAFYPKDLPDLFDTSKPKKVIGRGTRPNIRKSVPYHKEKITKGGSFRPA